MSKNERYLGTLPRPFTAKENAMAAKAYDRLERGEVSLVILTRTAKEERLVVKTAPHLHTHMVKG